jgi:hypothetical protein
LLVCHKLILVSEQLTFEFEVFSVQTFRYSDNKWILKPGVYKSLIYQETSLGLKVANSCKIDIGF